MVVAVICIVDILLWVVLTVLVISSIWRFSNKSISNGSRHSSVGNSNTGGWYGSKMVPCIASYNSGRSTVIEVIVWYFVLIFLKYRKKTKFIFVNIRITGRITN